MTAAAKKIYADGFAMFQRMDPAAPAGWDVNDDPKDGGGNPWLEITVVQPGPPGPGVGGGQSVVRFSGDPERVNALLKATKFR